MQRINRNFLKTIGSVGGRNFLHICARALSLSRSQNRVTHGGANQLGRHIGRLDVAGREARVDFDHVLRGWVEVGEPSARFGTHLAKPFM